MINSHFYSDVIFPKNNKIIFAHNYNYLIIVFLLIFTSCKTNSNSEDCFNSQTEINSDVTKINVFFDATLSMQGFANANNSILLTLIKNQFDSYLGNISSNKNYFVFGDEVNKVSYNELKKIDQPQFYNPGFKKTKINLVIDSINKGGINNLNVIITDLYENDADLNQILLKLRTTIDIGFSIAILGVKPAFQGKIYDVFYKGKPYSFNYSGKHPIFFIFIGNNGKIVNFFDRFKYDLDLQFSKDDYKFITYTKWNSENSNNLLSPKTSKILKKNGNYSKEEEYFVFKGDYFELIPNFKFKPYSIYSELSEIELKFKDQTISSHNGKILQESGKISIKSVDKKIIISINKKNLGDDQFCIESKVFAEYKPQLDPSWFSDWTLTQQEIRASIQDPMKFPGNKTINLEYFLTQLAYNFGGDIGYVRFKIK